MKKAVFLDRDGVLMRDSDYVSDPRDVRVYRGAAPALKLLRRAGWLLIVTTNQSGIFRKYFTHADLEKVNAELARQLRKRGARWDALYVSPHGPDSRHPWRKPGTGMLKAAAKRFGLDLKACWMIGDKTSDIKAGKDSGGRAILVRTGKAGRDKAYAVKPDFTCRDVLAAAKTIVRCQPSVADGGGAVF